MVYNYIFIIKFFFHVATPRNGPGPLRYRGFTITLLLHLAGLLWTGDQDVARRRDNA